MTIEQLKDLKKLVSENMLTSLDATTAIRFLIDAEIRRQSDKEPTVEEIAKVTGWMLRMREAFKRGDE